MPPGFLAVFSEPGANVSMEEYQDWYNNEHIPIRLNYILLSSQACVTQPPIRSALHRSHYMM